MVLIARPKADPAAQRHTAAIEDEGQFRSQEEPVLPVVTAPPKPSAPSQPGQVRGDTSERKISPRSSSCIAATNQCALTHAVSQYTNANTHDESG